MRHVEAHGAADANFVIEKLAITSDKVAHGSACDEKMRVGKMRRLLQRRAQLSRDLARPTFCSLGVVEGLHRQRAGPRRHVVASPLSGARRTREDKQWGFLQAEANLDVANQVGLEDTQTSWPSRKRRWSTVRAFAAGTQLLESSARWTKPSMMSLTGTSWRKLHRNMAVWDDEGR